MNDIDPLHALARRLALSHAWLLGRALASSGIDDDGRQRLRHAQKHADGIALDAAAWAGEDKLLVLPDSPPIDAVGWLEVGLSGLVFLLVLRHVRPRGEPEDSTADTPYAAAAETPERFVRYALRRASVGNPRAIERRIELFELPVVEAWTAEWLKEAAATLRGRLPLRAVLREAVTALRAAGLPDELLTYLGPQVDRHGGALGFGLIRRKVIKVAIRAIPLR